MGLLPITCSTSAQRVAGAVGGDNYIAGGAGDNMIFGENGNDVIQGAGSIDIRYTLGAGGNSNLGGCANGIDERRQRSQRDFLLARGACRDAGRNLESIRPSTIYRARRCRGIRPTRRMPTDATTSRAAWATT